MSDGLDDLPKLPAPPTREWDATVRRWRALSERMAQTLVEFGMQHGLSATEARDFADFGMAVHKVSLLADLREGGLSLAKRGHAPR